MFEVKYKPLSEIRNFSESHINTSATCGHLNQKKSPNAMFAISRPKFDRIRWCSGTLLETRAKSFDWHTASSVTASYQSKTWRTTAHKQQHQSLPVCHGGQNADMNSYFTIAATIIVTIICNDFEHRACFVFIFFLPHPKQRMSDMT